MVRMESNSESGCNSKCWYARVLSYCIPIHDDEDFKKNDFAVVKLTISLSFSLHFFFE